MKAMQCAVSLERRNCLIRRAGETSKIEELKGFYTGGLYCSERLRGNGRATSMMLRLLGTPSAEDDARHGLPFAKVYDQDDTYLPHV